MFSHDSSDSESGDETESEDDEDTVVLERPHTSPKPPERVIKKAKAVTWKQVVRVDKQGKPYGKEAGYLAEDVKAFAKGLNPCYGWADQPLDEKQRFFARVYAGTTSS